MWSLGCCGVVNAILCFDEVSSNLCFVEQFDLNVVLSYHLNIICIRASVLHLQLYARFKYVV